MEWTEDSSLLLIELYRERPILWDPTTPSYKMTKRKTDCWQEVADELDVAEVAEVRKKMDSLLASYRRERRRETFEDYESKWFGYQALRFLNEKFQNYAKNTLKFSNASRPKDQPHHHHNNNTKSEPQSPSTSTLSLIGDVAEDVSNENEDNFILQHQPLKTELTADRNHQAPEDHKLKHARPPKKKLKRHHPLDSTRQSSSVHLKNLPQDTTGKEECTAYGDYVGCRLQSFSPYTRAMVKQQFNNIIFDAEMGKFQESEFQVHHPAVVHDGYLLDDQTAAGPSSVQTTDSGEDAEVIVGT